MTAPFSASIVLYNNDPEVLSRAVHSALQSARLETLFLVDNSDDGTLSTFATMPKVEYDYVGRNIGFGAAHNRALARSRNAYHAMINPDVEFSPGVIPALIDMLQSEPDAALAGPALTSEQGVIEHWCRRRPTPFDLIARRFLPATSALDARRAKFERHDLPLDKPSDVEVLSGAFLVCSTDVLKRIGGFDSRYFLYLEDYDLCRSVLRAGYRCIFDPRQTVLHKRGAHSYSRLRPLLWHINSAIRYFNKWGWRPFA